MANKLSVCLEADLFAAGAVVITDIDKLHFGPDREFVATTWVVLQALDAIADVRLHVSFSISAHFCHSVEPERHLLGLNVAHVDHTFEST